MIANHLAYMGSWIKAVRDDKNEIFRAAKGAQGLGGLRAQLFRSGHRKIKSYELPAYLRLFGVKINIRLGPWYESEAFYSSDLANVARG
jgi:hypothetical protein